MRTIVHLSDLHFGAADDVVVAAVLEHVRRLRPDAIAVSGDLTQRARAWQFRQARAFLDALPNPKVVVPGNHDRPLYNVIARVLRPLAGFRRHISRESHPVIALDDVLMIGADTARSLTVKAGGLRRDALEHLETVLRRAGDVLKIVVCHHPFDPATPELPLLSRRNAAARAVAALVDSGADVLLTGHRHVSRARHSAIQYRATCRSAILVEAGTATSTRVRSEPNAFNVLRVNREAVVVERFAWSQSDWTFQRLRLDRFERSAQGWIAVPGHASPDDDR